MIISDLSIKRPVLAAVFSMLLLAFGIVALDRLPLREYPSIDPPIVSISTNYRGASASIIETRITELIEDRISGIEGIRYIESSSIDGQSRITVEFEVDRDIDGAVNDIRDRVSAVLDDLPVEADPPDIQKADSSDDVILWLNLVSDRMSTLELTDYARRYLQDRFSVLSGVARVRIGGGLEYAMRIWIDTQALAARQLTIADVESALRQENVELPGGTIESQDVQFIVRIKRLYQTPEQFENLVIAKSGNYLIRLKDIARVEKSAVENRIFFRGNQQPMIGIGIVKQSQANTIEVTDAAIELSDKLKDRLPEGMKIINSYNTAVFVKGAIQEVFKTLLIALCLVAIVTYLFLGNFRSMMIPSLTVPISIISSFLILYSFNYSLNLLTLLGLVIAIGLVIDDAIVILENISRRVEKGETLLVASYLGTRQVSFAVIATSIVLISVFVPIGFLEGNLGRLFSEFSVTLIAAITFSTLVALTLCPMLASQFLKIKKKKLNHIKKGKLYYFSSAYQKYLIFCLRHKAYVLGGMVGMFAACFILLQTIPKEYAPVEDRGAFFIFVSAQEGASFDYTSRYVDEIEKRMMKYVENGEINRLLVRVPGGFGVLSNFNSGIIINVLEPWGERRSAFTIMNEIRQDLSDLPGVRAFPVMRQGFGGRAQKPVQFVIGASSYDDLLEYRDILLEKIQATNPGLTGIDTDYKETQPQVRVVVDKFRAADLGVSVDDIGRTLETLLGSRRVTTYIDNGEEYDVILEAEKALKQSLVDLENIYVRSSLSDELIPLSNIVTLNEFADSGTLNRYNRIRSITIEANLGNNLTLGEALSYLDNLVTVHLPDTVVVDYKGQSLEYTSSQNSIVFIFVLSLMVVFLVLAAQFESFIHPFVIVLTIPLTIFGALIGLSITGNTINIYTQISLVILIGLSAKNSILVVEFANQLRNEGLAFSRALIKACQIRFRPILMTGITTISGSLPLILSFGPGAETRYAIGIVLFFGVLTSILITLFIVPVVYHLFAKNTKRLDEVSERLENELGNHFDIR